MGECGRRCVRCNAVCRRIHDRDDTRLTLNDKLVEETSWSLVGGRAPMTLAEADFKQNSVFRLIPRKPVRVYVDTPRKPNEPLSNKPREPERFDLDPNADTIRDVKHALSWVKDGKRLPDAEQYLFLGGDLKNDSEFLNACPADEYGVLLFRFFDKLPDYIDVKTVCGSQLSLPFDDEFLVRDIEEDVSRHDGYAPLLDCIDLCLLCSVPQRFVKNGVARDGMVRLGDFKDQWGVRPSISDLGWKLDVFVCLQQPTHDWDCRGIHQRPRFNGPHVILACACFCL